MMFEVVAARAATSELVPTLLPGRSEPPHSAASAPEPLRPLLMDLASVWHDYRSRAWRTSLLHRIRSAQFTRADYVRWMSSWIPQVRQGTQWMRAAAAQLDARFTALTALMHTHAAEEQSDYQVLFEDYLRAGGTESDIDALRRNAGGEALNAYLHRLANDSNPLGLLGAIYIIEGTGQRIVPALLPLLRKLDDIPQGALRFLTYHGENDTSHLQRWLHATELAVTIEPACARRIIEVARTTADLYLLQMEHAL
jgi:3-oxoacyl-[acyl-carrier-protein] synthase-3